MAHVSDFTQNEDKIVLDLINEDNGLELTLAQVSLTNPVTNPDTSVTVQLGPVPGSGYGDVVEVSYGRLDIQAFANAEHPSVITLPVGTAQTMGDFLDEVNVVLGTAIPATSVIDDPIPEWSGAPGEQQTLPLKISNASLVYKGKMDLVIESKDVIASFTRYKGILKSGSSAATNSLYATYTGRPGSLEYRINGSAWAAVPTTATLLPETEYTLDLRSNSLIATEQPTLVVGSGVSITEILFFQEDFHPYVAFPKSGLVKVPGKIPPTMTSTSQLFSGAAGFNQDISGWDVSKVTNMNSMFVDTTIFNQPIGTWNVAAVTTMQNMFLRAKSFNQDISGWNVSNVTNMLQMFRECSAYNKAMNGWNTSKVTSMQGMFYGATAFNQNITSWSTLNVTTMYQMFYNAAAFNQDISGWDVSKVNSMQGMFFNAGAFNQDLSSWVTSNVTDMSQMFLGAIIFNKPLNAWNTAKVASIASMFYGATAFNQPLNTWDTSKVTNMNQTFQGAVVFNQDLSGWNVSAVGTHSNFDTGASAWTLPKPAFLT